VTGFTFLDWTIVGIYFALVFAVAGWSGRRADTGRTVTGFFLGGRNVAWYVVGASLFATNIGTVQMVALAGQGAHTGVVVAQIEITAAFALLLLGWAFAPLYLASGVRTMPEFLDRRYGPGPRFYLAVVSVAAYVFTKISANIAAGGIIFVTLLGIDFWIGTLIVVLLTGCYTVLGGLRAVLYTDALQALILIGGALAVTLIGLEQAGGWSGLRSALHPGFFDMWKPVTHPNFPWTGVVFGMVILGIWYWCTDQFIVQRVLAAADLTEARRGTLFAAYLKQLSLFIFVVPGMVAWALHQSGRLSLAAPDQALPALVATLLPAGIRGLVAAGLLAALMSSLSSVFNSCATLVTFDIYQRLRPAASERALVLAGRVATAAVCLFGLAWIPVLGLLSRELFTYVVRIDSYISPPIAALFVVGVCWPRANARGAVAALVVGFALGMLRLALEAGGAAPGGVAGLFVGINFLHFCIASFVLCCAVLVGVSLTAPAPPRARLAELTLRHAIRSGGARVDLAMSILLLALIAALWLHFS
jgi:SSS family solute:Na+ symporter